MTIETPQDLQGLLAIGRVVGQTLCHMREAVRPGMTTAELDALGQAFLARHRARSAPVLTYGFPGITCISINEEAAHGIPGERRIQPGDLVKIDVSAELDGYIADAAITVAVPPVSALHQRLCDCAEAALAAGIAAARAGQPLGQIGRAAERTAREHGFRIVRELHGHGVGRRLHEPPTNIPMYATPAPTSRLADGVVLTVEPHITHGSGQSRGDRNGWTIHTRDRGAVAMVEHTIVVTADRPIIVTAAG